MKVIKNTQLFTALKDAYNKDGNWWNIIATQTIMSRGAIPFLTGGLDHVELKSNSFFVYDKGVNERNNSFVVKPEI